MNISENHFPVIEGVMGYFDGLGGDTTAASSWEVADILDLPECWWWMQKGPVFLWQR